MHSLQMGSFNISREGVMGVHSAGEVWSMITLFQVRLGPEKVLKENNSYANSKIKRQHIH